MNYNLSTISGREEKTSGFSVLRKLFQLIAHEKGNLIIAVFVIFVNAFFSLMGPLIIGHTIDKYIRQKDFHGLLVNGGFLLLIYLIAFFTSFQQTKLMGRIGQRLLFTLRNSLFNKIQSLPVAFFNQNKTGDLISRINNDTDKINQFFSQALIQFISSIVMMTGSGLYMVFINWKLGAATLSPVLVILLYTSVVSPWVKKKSAANLKSVSELSGEIQESLSNFKVIIAFSRRDYFRKRFEKVNQSNYKSAVTSGIANNLYLPVYSMMGSLAQLLLLCYGIYLISNGQFTIGLLVSYFSYSNSFYSPLRQLATLWSTFQMAMAGWDRISQILVLESNLKTEAGDVKVVDEGILAFKDISFGYPGSDEILHHINFKLLPGKTYAFVGPTGGGKTTTASLMARLYDPQKGEVLLDGRNIKSYSEKERTEKIGFILQEPILFSGTIKENILYGNEQYLNYSNEEFEHVIKGHHLEKLIAIFENGLDTTFTQSGDSISLGQKQIIAFMRAILREPDLLILDEATANIDTITEQLLEEILSKLPASTTKVIIAHRLNTIKNADEIFFVNSGSVIAAGSFEHALDLLMNEKGIS